MLLRKFPLMSKLHCFRKLYTVNTISICTNTEQITLFSVQAVHANCKRYLPKIYII